MRTGWGRCEMAFPCGFFPTEGFDRQVHPLYARAFAAGDAEPIVIVSVDMTSLPDQEVLTLQSAVTERTGIAGERIWIVASHTFSAPHLMPDHLLKTQKDQQNKATLRQIMANAVCSAAAMAIEGLRETELTLHQGESAVAASRDIELPEGWWIGCGGTGPADRTLTVLKVGTGDEVKGLLVHLNVQSSVLDGTGTEHGKCVSCDLAGLMCAELERRYPGAIAVFLTGAAGDMAPVQRAKGYAPDGCGGWHEIDLHEKGIDVAEQLGAQLAQEAQALLMQPGERLIGGAGIRQSAVTVPAKKMNRNLHELRPTRVCEWKADGENEQPVSLLTLGKLAVVGVRPELTYATDQQIKQQSPFPYTLCATMVNGSAKYMADMSAYTRCMYEAINSPFAPGAAERLAQAAISLLNDERR